MVSLPGAPGIHVSVVPGVQAVEPGATAVFDLTVTNLASVPQHQHIAIEGLPTGWTRVTFDEERQAVPGEQRAAGLTVSVPDGVEGGVRPFRIVAVAGDDRGVADCVLRVSGEAAEAPPPADGSARSPAPGLALNPAEVTVEAGAEREATIRLAVRNVGTQEQEFSLSIEGLQPLWYRLPARLRVRGGAVLETDLQLRLPATAAGSYPFTVRAAPPGDPGRRAEASGVLTVVARAAEPTEPTEGVPSQERATLAAAAVPPEVVLGPETTFKFGPGQITEQATIRVQNRSRLLEGYAVAVTGLPEAWYRLAVREVRLEPGGAELVSLRLNPVPGGDHPAGEYPFRVRVTPLGSPDAFSEIGGIVAVSGTSAFDARVAPQQARGRSETYKVTLRNTGTQVLSLWIDGSDREGMCRFDYPPPPNLEPGEERVLPVKVGVRRNRFVGEAETYDFALRALPAGAESSAARSFDAQIVHEPYLGRRTLKWSLLAAFAVVLVGIVLRIGVDRIPDASDWVRCRVTPSAQFCVPVRPRVPRLEFLDPQASADAPLLLALPPTELVEGDPFEAAREARA